MSKYNPKQLKARRKHKVPVTFILRDEVGRKQEVVADVIYRGLSLDDQPDFPTVEGLEGKERIEAVKKQLAALVVAVPDFGVGPAEEGYEQPPDESYFGEMEIENATAISVAIGEARSVPTSPTAS